MSLRTLVCTLSTVVPVLSLAACSTTDDGLETLARDADPNGTGTATLCHIPPDDPENPQTITVGAPSVAAHLDHGDTIGPCPTACESQCDSLALAVGEFCGSAPLPPDLPEDFCELATNAVEDSCDAACPEPEPEACANFCAGIASSTSDACLELTMDPFVCEVGANVTYQECVVTFDCPPPPPTCFDTCFAALDEALQLCEAAGGDPACFDQAHAELQICESGCCVSDCNDPCQMQCGSDPECVSGCQESCSQICEPPPPSCDQLCSDEANLGFQQCLGSEPDPTAPCAGAGVEQACLVQWQGVFNDCLFGEAGCIDPAGDCFLGCSMASNDAFLACISEPLCQDPGICQVEASLSFDACAMACQPPSACPPDLVECPDGVCIPPGEPCPSSPALCEQLCGPDPMCLQDCCQSGCLPDDPACTDECCLMACELGSPDPAMCVDQCFGLG